MMRPEFSRTDDETSDLLSLVADTNHVSAAHEWDVYVTALHLAADSNGVIQPNALRPLVRGKVAPKRLGAFSHRALTSGLLEATGAWQISDDTEGRNAGKPCRVLRLATQSARAAS